MAGMLWTTLCACDNDPMRQGTAAVIAGQPEIAEQNLKKVLKNDPENAEALRLLADVHRLRGNYRVSEQALDDLWKLKGFSDPGKKLSSEDKALRNRIDQQYNDLYVEWVGQLDPHEDPETYEDVLRRGIARDEKSKRLNELMVDFLTERAERDIEASRKAEAAVAYEEVLKFRALPRTREDAATKSRNLKLELFTAQVAARVEELKPRLQATGRWSAEREGPRARVRVELDRKLRPENPDDLQQARAAARPNVVKTLSQLVAEITGVEVPQEIIAASPPANHTENELLRRGQYSIDVIIAVDVAIRYAFEHPPTVKTPDSDEGITP